MYKRAQVYEETLKYFRGDTLAANVWIDKYCLKDSEDEHNIKYFELHPADMHIRLTKEFARIEQKYPNPMCEHEIYDLLKGFKYIVPQGSPMAGIGNNLTKTSISNCFVIGGHADSYGGIMMADEEQVQLMKRRGGVGQDISFIRPSGALANGAPLGPNAGMPLYMNRYSNSTGEVQQDGRRGALMLSVSIKHPDAGLFIDKKMTPGEVTDANVSVRVDDDFMRALAGGLPYYQVFPVTQGLSQTLTPELSRIELEYDKLYIGEVINGIQTYLKKIDPKKLWEKIIHNAWKSAEPGILFWDQILRESPAAFYGPDWKEKSTNPCGEIPLCPYDSCRLLSLNLYSYINSPFTKFATFDVGKFSKHVKKAMRMMDDIVDLEIEKIDKIVASIKKKKHEDKYQRIELELWEEIRKKAVNGRRTGLGVLGEGDAVAAMGLRYGTKQATDWTEALHQLLASKAYESSIEMAKERGAFPMWDVSEIDSSDFLKRMFASCNTQMDDDVVDQFVKTGRRNIGLLTIAPTGSVSLLTQTTSGIENVFAAYYFRKRKVAFKTDIKDENGDYWEEYVVLHKPFVDWFSIAYKGFNGNFLMAKQVLENCTEGRLAQIFKRSPYYKATAQDVDYIEKVVMQGAIQKWVDHSISVTVNMPKDVTPEVVAKVYETAHEVGCKGMTVYRDGSRGNVLSTESSKKDVSTEDFDYVSAVKRPAIVECDVLFRQANLEEKIVFVGIIDDKPYELFAVPFNDETRISKRVESGLIEKMGKGHYRFTSDSGKHVIENLCDHMIENEQNSTRMVSGMLRHRAHPRYISKLVSEYATISSLHKVIEKVLLLYVKDPIIDPCPECGKQMIVTDGCMKCIECGYSKCG